jgi:hypothetical protein
MLILQLPRISRDYITAALDGAPADIVGNVVQIALDLYETPVVDVTWLNAEWDPDAAPTAPAIRWLYPGDQDAGFYALWSKVTDNPEIPVRKHGYIHLI